MLYVFVFDFNIIVYSQFIQSDIIQVCCSIKNINSEYIIFLPDLIIFASRAVDIPTGDTHIPSDMSIGIHKPQGYSYHCDTAKDMKCASFPNLVLSTLLALMNVLVTFNAHLSLSDTFAIVSPSFLFFTPFCPVPHCLVLYFAIWFTFLCLHFVLMKSIWLAFILSRDVFVLTRIKTRVVFPRPPLLTPDEGPSLETSIFALSFQVVREPLPFAYHWIHYLH